MEALGLIHKALENTKFVASIKGIYTIEDSISYTTKFDGHRLEIIACPESILQYGFLKGIANTMINTIRSEFKEVYYKEIYDSDKWIEDEFIKRLENKPTYMIYKNEIKTVNYSYHEGKVRNIDIHLNSGAIINICSIVCTNLEKSKKTLEKFKA